MREWGKKKKKEKTNQEETQRKIKEGSKSDKAISVQW